MGNEELARLREAVGWVRNALKDHDLFRASVRLDELETLLAEPLGQEAQPGTPETDADPTNPNVAA